MLRLTFSSAFGGTLIWRALFDKTLEGVCVDIVCVAQAKLDQGEECLSSALPVDVAALLKQFFRELPEPVLSTELHAALLKAQELPTKEERTSATMLLSCVLPERNLNTLRYFFSFLQSVSQRYSSFVHPLF